MTADSRPLNDLLDQLEGVVSGLVLESLADGVIVSLDDRLLIEVYPDERYITENATPTTVRRAFAAVNALKPFIEVVRAAEALTDPAALFATYGRGVNDLLDDLDCRLEALRDALSLALEEEA